MRCLRLRWFTFPVLEAGMQFKPILGALLGLACIATSAAAQRTHAALTAADLRTRLFALAHDSMMGRAPGDIGDFKATAYIAAEFSRLGLTPASRSRISRSPS